MGARRLREWLAMPIKDISELNLRYDTISAFVADEKMLEKVRSRIGDIGDLERIISKASAGKLLPLSLIHISFSYSEEVFYIIPGLEQYGEDTVGFRAGRGSDTLGHLLLYHTDHFGNLFLMVEDFEEYL